MGLRPFKPGQSGNPGGRPKADILVRDLARKHTTEAVEALVKVATKGKSESARVAAAVALLDRGWGRAPQEITVRDERPLSELSDAELVAIATATEDEPIDPSKLN